MSIEISEQQAVMILSWLQAHGSPHALVEFLDKALIDAYVENCSESYVDEMPF